MYSPVSKYSPETRKRMPCRSKSKSCSYYMKIVFFFSSLIQSLIIVSLVLFLVYGKQQDSTSVDRIRDLETRFNRLSIDNVDLRLQRKNLTNLLNVTLWEKARNDWDLAHLMFKINVSYHLLDDTSKKLQQCLLEKRLIMLQGGTSCPTEHRVIGASCNCGHEMELLKARMEYIKSNFTQTAMKMQMEMDQIAKERDNLNLEAIQLRRDKSMHEKEIQFYKIKCKNDFVQSLSGVLNVSKAFLHKIDSLFPSHLTFQLTCPKQKEHLEQIRTNCTNLSREVEDRFQRYLNTVGDQVSAIQGENSRLTAENWRMSVDYRWCSQNRTGLIEEHKQNLDRIQEKNDVEKEKLLKEKMKLNGQNELMERSVRLKEIEIQLLKEQMTQLNMSCLPRTGFGGLFPNVSPPRTGTQSGSNWPLNTGSLNSGSFTSTGGLGQAVRNPVGGSTSSNSNSFGSSFGSAGLNSGLGSSLGSANSGFNKQPSTGLGSSKLDFGSSASNTGLGSTGLNRQGSSNQGSSSYGSPFGSNPSSSGSGLNKPGSTGLGSSAFGSSLGSTSSNNPSLSGSSSSRFGASGATGATGASSSGLGSNFGSSSSSFGTNHDSNQGSSQGSSQGSGSTSSSRTTQTSRGSSNSLFGSSSSLGSSLGSSLNKPSTAGKSSLGSSSSSSSSSGSSSGTTSKSPFGSWWGLGAGSSSSSDHSKIGSTQGRGSSSGGNNFGSFGKNSAYTGPISLNQHLQDLQRIINPPGPEEKQELSRVLG